jgi:hypothetical protein
VLVPHGFGHARDLDVICLDRPSGEVIELSSSCDLFVFSPKAEAQCAEGDGNTPEIIECQYRGVVGQDGYVG